MTIKEAISQLEDLKRDRESFLTGVAVWDNKVFRDDILACDMAIEALQKMLPKKPYFRVEEDTQGYACSICDFGVTIDKGRIRLYHCSNCGQTLDWSKENDKC